MKFKFKCAGKNSESERSEIQESFYSLSSANKKRRFLINTTKRFLTARPKRVECSEENQSVEDEDDWMDGGNNKEQK